MFCTPFLSWGHEQATSNETVFLSGNPETAPVVISGRELFDVVGLTGFSARQRAHEISERIERLANNKNFDPESLVIKDSGTYHHVVTGNDSKYILTVTERDAQVEGFDRELLAIVLKKTIAKGIEMHRNDRKPEVLKKNAIQAAVRTMLLIALVFCVIWGFRRTNQVAEKMFRQRVEKLESQSARILRVEQIWNVIKLCLRILLAGIILFLVYVFLAYVLSLFPWTRYIAEVLLDWIMDPLVTMGAAVVQFIPNLIFLVMLYYFTRWILKVIRSFFRAIERGRLKFKGFYPEWATPTYRIVFVGVLLFAVVIAYPYIPGSGSDAFQGMTILVGVLLSIGSASMVSNLIGGYMMTYRRVFRAGDRIRVGDTVGDVLETRTSVTHIMSPKNEEVVIPNSLIMNSEVINYSSRSREGKLILYTTVGIGYEVPWRQVKAMLILAAERTGGVLKEPKPYVYQKSLADYAVNYELNVYCDNAQKMASNYDELHGNIQDVFNEYGVQIMTPSYMTDTPDSKTVPKENWYQLPAKPPDQAED